MSPKRTDANQAEIIAALRQVACVVQDLHLVGHGCPDLLVSRQGHIWLIECKGIDPRLTPDERKWHASWAGPVYIARTVEDALRIVGALDGEAEGE